MDVIKRLARRAGTGAEAALGVAMAMMIVLNALVTAGSDRRYWPFGLGVGIAICATAMLRGRYRIRVVVTGLVLFATAGLAVALWNIPPGPLFGGGLIGLLVLGAAAVRTLPPRPAAIIGVAGTVVVAAGETADASGLFDHRTVYALTGITAWNAALAVGLWLRYLDVRHRETLKAVRQDERLELARELHDVVAHHVTGIVVQAQAARFTGEEHPERLISALGSIETAGTETLAAIRQLVGLLRDPDDTPGVAPGPEPISQLVERFAEHGPEVDLRLPAGLPASGWPPEVASTVYRIVQEALTNVARHAPGARSVTVTVTHDPRQVRVEITDDAPATASRHPRPGGGYGLVGMGERVEALGGKLRAGPLPVAGWAVQASLPVPAHGRP
jgi:signal transduction histidine kinase